MAARAANSGTSPATSASPAAVPALGRPAGDFAHGTGFGLIKPAKTFSRSHYENICAGTYVPSP
jgi:hypothetical protein